MQHPRQLTPEPSSAELDELYTLLRAGRSDDAGVKQRAVAIIQEVPAEELYCFMQLLLHTTATSQGVYVQCSSGMSLTGTDDEAPDSPQRLAPAIDQLCSAGNNADKGFDSCPEEDLQQLPDSPIQRTKRPASSSPQQQTPSGRFLAESLDLNLGASFDLLSKASLADFSSAAAAARLSTSNLIRQSHMMRSTMLSPVAEGSLMSAAPGELQQHEVLSDVSESALEYAAALRPRSSTSSTGYHHQEGYEPHLPDPREWAPDNADLEFSPSTCSSPREPQPSAAGQAAAAVRRSVAESAHDWPRAQPLPFTLQEAELQDSPAHEMQQMPALTQLVASQDGTPAAPWAAPAATAPDVHAVQVAQQQQRGFSTPPAAQGPPAAISSTPSSAPQVPAKRGGGPNPLGLITAPIAGANALRRSIGRLWGGGKKANNSNSSKSKLPAAPAPSSSSSSAQRSLACASAPMAAYGGASGSSRPGSRLPGFKQAGSPALRQPLQGFAVTQQGSSPTKAAAAAVAASAANSSSRTPSSAIGSGRSGSSITPQRPQGGSIGYRPPGSAGRGAAGTGAVVSPRGRDTLSTGSRIPSQIAGAAAGVGSGFGRAGNSAASSRQPTALPQQQRGGLSSHTMHYERPSSQASVTTYARSDATGSHTSAGPLGGFSGTHKALAEKKTPVLKQPASRLQQRQQAQQRAVQAATATLASAGAGSSRIAQQLASNLSGITGMGQLGQTGAVQGGYGLARQATQQSRGPAQGGSRGRDGGGGGARSQLRRSRSCGSMAEMLNVSELRSMWKELEKQHAVVQQALERAPRGHGAAAAATGAVTPAAAVSAGTKHGLRLQHGSPGSAVSPAVPAAMAHSSIGRGGSRQQQQQVAARAGSFSQQPSHGTAAAAAAAAAEHGEEDTGLPVLSRCHSPNRCPGQDKGAGVGASQVLARMGNVLGQVDNLLAGGAACNTAAGSDRGSTGSNMGAVRQGAGIQPSTTAGAGMALAAGIGQSPSALVYKLVKGAASGIGGPAAPTTAAEIRMGIAAGSRGVGLGMQQTLLTPPAKIGGAGGAVRSPGEDRNPVSSPDDGPAVSSSSSQVRHDPLYCLACCMRLSHKFMLWCRARRMHLYHHA